MFNRKSLGKYSMSFLPHILQSVKPPSFCFAEEMDWDKNGMVNFKEFLFAFTHWVGIEDNEDEEGEE